MRDLKLVLAGAGLVIVGAVVGALLFRAEPATAQAQGYSACVIGHQETHDINGRGEWERADRGFAGDRIIRVPRGWEVVSGGGGLATSGRIGFVLICRR